MGAGLYLHIPFCSHKCGYCDFVSDVFPADIQHAYLDALKIEFDRRLLDWPEGFDTIYVGGGSPSSLDDAEWRTLVALLRHCISASVDAGRRPSECTVEMNPGQVTAAKLSDLAGLATRISLGVQTFDPALRRAINRRPFDIAFIQDVVQLIKSQGNGGFDLSVDLMHSLPGQSLAQLGSDLDRVNDLALDHVSAYALTVEEGTPLASQVQSGAVKPCDDRTASEALALVRSQLRTQGLKQYEISNFARSGKACRHNLATWAGEEYLGIGAAAAGYRAGERTRNESDIAGYIQRIRRGQDAVSARERLSPRARAGELAMLNLRSTQGIDKAAFMDKTGFDPSTLFWEAIAKHSRHGWLTVTDTHIRLTEAGLDWANAVMIDFL